MVWWILPGAVGLFGVIILLTAFGSFGKFRLMSGTTRLLSGGGVLALAGFLSMLGLNLQTYSRLTHEQTIATIDVAYLEPQFYLANVRLAHEVQPRPYEVRGDEIEFKARIIKWSPWANIIGYDAVYRLDRLAGQYTDIQEDLQKPRTVYRLHDERGVDTFELVKKRGGWLKAVDAYYGSGTYVPMIAGASYEIIMTQNGLIARPLNEAARKGLHDWVPRRDTAPASPVTSLMDKDQLAE